MIDKAPFKDFLESAGPLTECQSDSVSELAWLDLVEDGSVIMRKDIPPIVQIVGGLVAEQSKLIIGSGSKSYKTWFTMDLALSVAHGIGVLERRTTRRRVLYANLELKAQTFERRLQAIAKAKQIEVDPEWFLHLPLRGKLSGLSVFEIITRLIGLARHFQAGVVAIDPVYKLNTAGDENSSRDQTLLFNEFDRLTTEAECTVILNDHFGKGNQSEKDPLDALRGSSAKGGDVDAAMILRKHDEPDCFRVDVIHRELPPVAPFTIGWEYPLMRLRRDLDPERMKRPQGGRAKRHDERTLLGAIKERTVENPISVSEWASELAMNRTTLNGYIPAMRAKGWIATVGEGAQARKHITEKGLAALAKLPTDE
ncbi:MAG: AAA family ATPase [Verrucomicrobiales bacterium]|nr:AAA family ATPase [Verrucomicrobiales bacterium]